MVAELTANSWFSIAPYIMACLIYSKPKPDRRTMLFDYSKPKPLNRIPNPTKPAQEVVWSGKPKLDSANHSV